MGRAEVRVPVSAELVEVRQADELRPDDCLAFAYGPEASTRGIRMSPVRAGQRGPVKPAPGWVWGKVAGVSEQLWRSFPVVTEQPTVWVLCRFGDHSSIITGIPCEVMVVIRRLAP